MGLRAAWPPSAGPRREGYEDGTVPFLTAGAVVAALDGVQAVGRDRLVRHLRRLTSELICGLLTLHHRDGRSLVRVHGPTDSDARDATVAISMQTADGATLPYWKIEATARVEGLAVRGGCFCNPGCAERAFSFPSAHTERCLESLGADFTIPRFAECLGGRGMGAIRLSLGLGRVRADVHRALAFCARFAE